MNTVALNDFISYARITEKVIDKFKNIIPEALMSIWKNYGLGTFMNGYIKVINPEDYQDCLKDSYFRSNVAVPILVTAFGDIITWERGGYISIVYYRYGKFELMMRDFNLFLSRLSDKGFLNEFFSLNQYYKAINEYGHLMYKECFGYMPLLALGGEEDTNGLKKVQIGEHIALINSYSGTIM